MIGLDTNVLARYYVDDASDKEAVRQRAAAKRLIESGQSFRVATTVLMELEWVLRGYYEFTRTDISSVFEHLLAMPHVTVQDAPTTRRMLVAYSLAHITSSSGMNVLWIKKMVCPLLK